MLPKLKNSYFQEHFPMVASETIWLNKLGITSVLKRIHFFLKVSCFHQTSFHQGGGGINRYSSSTFIGYTDLEILC